MDRRRVFQTFPELHFYLELNNSAKAWNSLFQIFPDLTRVSTGLFLSWMIWESLEVTLICRLFGGKSEKGLENLVLFVCCTSQSCVFASALV